MSARGSNGDARNDGETAPVVHRSSSRATATQVAAVLGGDGIDTVIVGTDANPFGALIAFAEFRVMVPVDQGERAEALLATVDLESRSELEPQETRPDETGSLEARMVSRGRVLRVGALLVLGLPVFGALGVAFGGHPAPARPATRTTITPAPLPGITPRPRYRPPVFDPPSEGDRSAWKRACGHRDAAACGHLGSTLLAQGRRKDALELLEKGCHRDDGASCMLLGTTLLDESPESAFLELQRGCALKSGVACTNAGFALSARGSKSDPEGAGKLFKIGCDLGDANGCNAYGSWLLDHGKAPHANAVAEASFRRACEAPGGRSTRELPTLDLGRAYGCTNLAFFARDPRRKLELFQTGCERGSPRGCYAVGLEAQNGDLAKADPLVAAAYHRQACDLGADDGCNALGLLLLSGTPRPDRTAALALLRGACDRRHAASCRDLGLELLGADDDVAVGLLQRACDGKDGRACAELAQLGQSGRRGVSADPKFVKTLFSRACESGYPAACAR
jgi:TPR repeat protein